MTAPATIDFDDAEGLLAADRGGLLRGASMAGAQVRATAAALDEGALDPVAGDPPRTVIWVAGRGNAETAGSILAAAVGASAASPIVVCAEVPPWIGALDVLVIAGDDGDAAHASLSSRPMTDRCATPRPVARPYSSRACGFPTSSDCPGIWPRASRFCT